MIDPTVAKTVAELGVPTAILVVLLLFGGLLIPKLLTWNTAESKRRDDAIAAMQEQMVSVVSNNTAAITRLCDSTNQTVDQLEQHDLRAQRIEATIIQIGRVTDRIEGKVDALKPGQVDALSLSRRKGLQ